MLKNRVRLLQVVSVLIIASILLAMHGPIQAQNKVEVVFWKHSHPPADELSKKIIEEYQQKNPNVTIKMEIIPSDQYLQKVATAAAGNQLPDMFDLNEANIAVYQSRNLLAAVDPVAFGFKDQKELEAAYTKDSLNPFKGADGKIYGIPFEYNSWTMIINDKIFKEAGLDPAKDYPKNWEEVGTIGAKLAKVKDGKFERQGFAWNLVTSGWTMLLYSPLVYQLGGSILSDDDKGKTCAVNKPEGVKALQTMQEMYSKYKTGAPGINLSTAQDAMIDFDQEKMGMWILGPWAISSIKNPEVLANYRIIPLPQYKDAKRKTVMLSSWVWNVNAASKNAAEAWKFTNYAQQQGARWLPAAGYVLPRLGWQDAPEAKSFKGLDVFVDMMQYARPRLIHPESAKIAAEIHKAVQEAVLNNKPAQEALDAACKAIDAVTNK